MTEVLHYDFEWHFPFSPWVFDKSWHWNWGTLKNGAHIKNSKLVLDGIDDYVKTSKSSSLDITDKHPLTLVARVKINKKTDTDTALTICGITGQYHFYCVWKPGKPQRVIDFKLGGVDYLRFRPFSFGKWYHLKGTYDGATMKLYVNGDLVASKGVTGSIHSSDRPFWVGEKGLGAEIKSVTVYDQVK